MNDKKNSIETREYVFKIVVLGEAAVGKTSLINQFVEESFEEDYKPTLGANIIRKDVKIEEINSKIRLILWDLAGQEKYESIRGMYFQGTVGALLVYDITRHNTYELINSKWLQDYKKNAKKEGAYILIGNKKDLKDQRMVESGEGRELADKINACDFVETSAKYNENVEKAFTNLVYQILRNYGEDL
ncbi:MAG: Small GTP-binding domain protein [Promethearchaeota archaeon]|nr:MAG: Small GTP-binding domain protein [Candidatus Lokiarchaeota archaeon]